MSTLHECVQDIAVFFEQLTSDNVTLLEKSTTIMDYIETQSS